MAINAVTERHTALRDRIVDRRFREAFADAAADFRPGSDADLASTTLIPGWFLTACVKHERDRRDVIYVAVDRDTLDRKLAAAGMPVLERCQVVAQLAAATTPELESVPVSAGADNPWPDAITTILDRRHWNQTRLAAELGCTGVMVSIWKLGKQRPGPKNAAKLRRLMEEVAGNTDE